MTRLPILLALLAVLLTGQLAHAQYVQPGAPQLVPVPPPPPPPKIEVPKVPQFDAPPRYNYKPAPRTAALMRVAAQIRGVSGLTCSGARKFPHARCSLYQAPLLS